MKAFVVLSAQGTVALCLKLNYDSSSGTVFFTERAVTFLQEFWLETAYLLYYNLHDAWSVTILPPLLILELKTSINKKFNLKSKCFRINAIINHFIIHSFYMMMTHFCIQVYQKVGSLCESSSSHIGTPENVTCAVALVSRVLLLLFLCFSHYKEKEENKY